MDVHSVDGYWANGGMKVEEELGAAPWKRRPDAVETC
jgi:hypothetical protein